MSSPKKYTAQDFQRYHLGDMTAAERHELEKDALDDPILADALEGYTHTNTANADLESLHYRLEQRTEEKKEERVFLMNSPWMKIAALFLLLAGAGWLVFNTFPGNQSGLATSTAQREISLPKETAVDSPSLLQIPPTVLYGDTLQQSDDVIASNSKKTKESPAAVETVTAAPFTVMSDMAKTEQSETATTQPENNDKTTSSDIATLRSSVPANTSREVPDTGKLVDMAQQRTGPTNEGFNTRRMQSAKAKTATMEDAEPEGGWQAFEKYITNNRKSVEAAQVNAAAGGEVELQFTIAKNGRPIDIIVTKSLCEKCDNEAIRLLKEGPDWKGKNGKVTIAFSR